ncbi:MAG: HAD-IA family hydrolase [Bacteroidota bacterium]
MKTALVVFDMAGTTVSDRGNVNQAFRDAFAAENIQVAQAEVDKLMGYRKIEAIARMVVQYAPGISEAVAQTALIERIHDRFNELMVDFYTHDTNLQPLPFAEELFQLLQDKGIKVALNTGFTRVITDAILQRLRWDKNPPINMVICSDEVPEGRPHPFMIKSIMLQLGITDAEQVVKVGDTEVDILEGRNAGCGFVAATTTGAYSRSQLTMYQPDAIIDSLQELPALIL